MNLEKGQRFSHYLILDQLGTGGMGVVYKAQDVRLKRTVALKLLLRRGESEVEVSRFLREAESAAALNHPRLAHVYEVDEEDGVPFIAMEFLPGGSLRERISRTRPSVDALLQWCSEVAEALVEAHRHQIVHRDVKPANVLLDEMDHAKLADFGLARRQSPRSGAEPSTRLTTEGIILGTPNYMSPEQALGQDIGPSADVFSLGCLMYELAAERPPFQRASAIDTLHATVKERTPSVNQWDATRAEGELLLSRGAIEEGLDNLRRAHIASKGLLTQTSLARALVLGGRSEEATELYREVVNSQPLAWDGHVEWALAHLKLAKLYDEAGEATNAEASCLKLLTIWKDADSDLPPLLEARHLLGSPIETR